MKNEKRILELEILIRSYKRDLEMSASSLTYSDKLTNYLYIGDTEKNLEILLVAQKELRDILHHIQNK